MKRNRSIKNRLITSILVDLAVLAVLLNTFAYFHHVRVRDTEPRVLAVPQAAQATAAPAAEPTESPDEAGPTETADAEAPSSDTGLLGGKFADRFTSGTVESDETSYRSANVSVSVDKVETGTVTYFVADIYIKDVSSFRTGVALAYKEHNTEDRKNVMQVLQMDELTDAVVAISGDNYVFRNAGVVAVRNGMEWEKQLPVSDDLCALFYDGVMETYPARSCNRAFVEALYARGPYQVWCFGPKLLDDDGQATTHFNSSVSKANPRSAVGYYEPGHYCFVLVDGRQKGYSLGFTLEELSGVFADLGCRAAYNLDGGDTVAMTFHDAVINRPEEAKPRSVSDILYIGEPLSAAGEG